MTAYEVGQRVQEYIRGALPIFEPMESERNGLICELTFDILMRVGAFGSPRDMPASLQGGIEFEFQSPLHDTIDQQKGQKFLESKALLAEAADLDQASLYMLDMRSALRDSLTGIGVPADWMNSKEDVDQMLAERNEQDAQTEELARMQQSADVANTIGDASQKLAG